MPPSEREEFALGLLQSLGNCGEGNSECHNVVILVKQYAAGFVGNIGHAVGRFLFYLLVGKWNEVINRFGKTVAVEAEELADHSGVLLKLIETSEMKLVAFLHYLGHTAGLLGDSMVCNHLVLKPVAFLFEPQLLHEIVIIRIVVETVEGRDVLVSFDEHSLLAERVIIERAVNGIHPLLLRPGFGSIYKKPCNLYVLDSIKPAETNAFLAVTLVVARVYHRTDAPCHPDSVKHHPHLVGAVLEGSILGKISHLLRVQGRNILRAALVEAVRETHEADDILGIRYLDYPVICHILQRY